MNSAFATDRRVTQFALGCALILQGCVGGSAVVNADVALLETALVGQLAASY